MQEKTKSRRKIEVTKYYLSPKRCIICNGPIPYNIRRRKTCSEKCLNIANKNNASKAGRVSSKMQNKRSKNEILFCELCEQYFGKENVLHNIPMFNGWDADVIIPNLKLAILWNGLWHYKKITKAHSLKQTQNRDSIKLKEIKKSMYTPYVIEDYGKYDKEKVNEEFTKLLEFLEQYKINSPKTSDASAA